MSSVCCSVIARDGKHIPLPALEIEGIPAKSENVLMLVAVRNRLAGQGIIIRAAKQARAVV